MLTPDRLLIPESATVFAAVDTGTFMSGLLVAVTRDHHAFVLEEFPNYRYVSDQTDLLDISNPEWAGALVRRCRHFQIRPAAWADKNTQFRAELRRYGLHLISNDVGPETRVSVTREYFQAGRIHLAPWLTILPYELENAHWPADVTASGRYERVKKRDHTLVCLEHILSRRPRVPLTPEPARPSFLQRYLTEHRRPSTPAHDPHLGAR